ncbi:hypothetical protein J2Z60_000156 [Lactobacillus colini]|uniref:Uncharacterized protein n=1 Tax=Lactobacillus colini TaxID=1819254 RepID=A0ABS4MBE1_9LACO|nr:hypothetical protein [Lactobacillus colini]MBP2056994.1 hypothetical protein [Lactobacillus colini]
MHGKVIRFNGNINNFKSNGEKVTITLSVDTADISLDALNDIAAGPIMIQLEASQIELLPQVEASDEE